MAVKIIPVSEVRQNLKDILATLEATGEPYFITHYSRPKAVLVRYEDYNALVDRAAEGHRPTSAVASRSSGGPASLCVTSLSGFGPASRWMTSWRPSLT